MNLFLEYQKRISDFNVDPLAGYLSSNPSTDVSIEVAPFGQVYQLLASDAREPVWASFIWTLPETSIPAFKQALDFAEVKVDQCLDEVDTLAHAILKYSAEKPGGSASESYRAEMKKLRPSLSVFMNCRGW